MDDTVSKLDFPNPINHIDIGDKPIIILLGRKNLSNSKKIIKDFNIGWTVTGINVIKF